VSDPDFFLPGMQSTPHSTVVAHGQKRMVLKQESEEDRKFSEHLKARLQKLDELGLSARIKV
jgi:hypothetical protein